ncbi:MULTISPECIES: PhzF family phenazine biosynthesis protein [unclassified Leifsonia]|uniref:PhzF family phenazine biosynthesis protein n=1 Tax=unclassified Leifsonia TaxID=2663824 RepID=UPI0006F7286C|nr:MULTISPECIES: PhzF family phenazine biosynthesis protein [unclassified Leifsonia]KQX08078.1 phenazine biosynthesis protein PhzF [Leifsonia sp. Root1293]KRA12359.1 phenazine biosynthesis protein PhzF [Leifsonia sp. Root60]
MTESPQILRYAAFTADPRGGNPAGVVLDAGGMTDAEMQRIAAEVDYAETAFVTGVDGGVHVIRYFSPIAEVPFCGHATIATAVAIAERDGAGEIHFRTPVGEIPIVTDAAGTPSTDAGVAAGITAAFTSVDPTVEPLGASALSQILAMTSLSESQLDERYPPRVSFAGNRHPIVVVADADVFDSFTFSPVVARSLMDVEGWAGTITMLRAIGPTEFEARNIFPVGRITEDPATGSAAASLGGYLRELGLVEPPSRVTVHQGRHVGRPSVLAVDIPMTGGITVSGTAVPIPD